MATPDPKNTKAHMSYSSQKKNQHNSISSTISKFESTSDNLNERLTLQIQPMFIQLQLKPGVKPFHIIAYFIMVFTIYLII